MNYRKSTDIEELLEKFWMGAETYEFNDIRVFIQPDQQRVTFDVALHVIFVIAEQSMWFILLRDACSLLKIA